MARALGAPVPRAIIAANGFTADPLKIYLSRASWVQPQAQEVLVQEIDVVGDRKQIPLRPVRIVLPKQAPIWYTARGAPTPALLAPRGARLINRFVVHSWIVGRFALDRPRRLSVKQLIALAPEYFHRPHAQCPADLLPEAEALMARPVQLSVVVPVYGCADCLLALHPRLTASVRRITDRHELVFVDDRSIDDGWSVLQRLAAQDDHVRAYRLSRNFGQDAAITAGLVQAAGE